MTRNRLAMLFKFIPTALIAGALLAFAAGGCGDNSAGPAKLVPLTLKTAGTGAPQAAGSRARGVSTAGALIGENGDTIPVTFTSAYLVVRDVRFKLSDDGSTDSSDIDDDDGDPSDTTGVCENDTTGVGEHEDDDDAEDDDGEHDDAVMIRFN